MCLFPTDQPSLPQKLPSIQSALFPFSVAQLSSTSVSAPGFQVFLSLTTLRTVLLYKRDTIWFLSNPSFSLELGPCLTLPMNFREYPRLAASLYIHLSFLLPQIIWNLVATFNTFPKVSCLKWFSSEFESSESAELIPWEASGRDFFIPDSRSHHRVLTCSYIFSAGESGWFLLRQPLLRCFLFSLPYISSS